MTLHDGEPLIDAELVVPYYAVSNPTFAAEGVRIIGEVLEDRE